MLVVSELFYFQFQADSSSTLPCPLKLKACPAESESDGSDGIDSAGIFVHESTQVCFLVFTIHFQDSQIHVQCTG